MCRFYLAPPLTSVSGVTGADLKLRIAAIAANRTADALNFGRKALLAATAVLAVAGPIAVGILSAPVSDAQSQAGAPSHAFEAASIKLHAGGISAGERTHAIEPGRITWFNANLGQFIEMAYGVKHYQVSGPEWIVDFGSTDRYDVAATAGSPVSADEVRRMLGKQKVEHSGDIAINEDFASPVPYGQQAPLPLLVERFHLAFHRETRELPVYVLVVTKGGPKFKASLEDGGPPDVAPDGQGGLSFKNWPMPVFADWLTGMPAVGRPVIDRTGLEGRYSFDANLFDLPKDISPRDMKIAMGRSDTNDAIFSTLPEQLGLKLEAQKAPTQIIVIDHADKVPVEN